MTSTCGFFSFSIDSSELQKAKAQRKAGDHEVERELGVECSISFSSKKEKMRALSFKW
jgi:hypothetical protein